MRNDLISSVLQRTCSFYAVLLLAYPSDFRRHFSDQMKEAFSCQIGDEWERNGLIGAFRVWFLALWELVSVAVPLQLQNTIFLAAGLSCLCSSALSLVFFWAIAPHCAK